ncbi:MAG: phage virion morphogenesis protein [Betaproteobacteria bacterium]|nr:phage virion morphogenesis protein [Betaproteobacteria bacterium]
MTPDIRIIGDEAVASMLQRLATVGKDAAPLMGNLSEIMLSGVQKNFLAGGRPAWVPLAPITVKRRGGAATPILRQPGSDQLYHSLAPSHGSSFAQVSTNKPYARIQNDGGTISFAPRSGTVRLRTDRKGNLLRQDGSNLARFAKGSHKRVSERRWTNSTGWSVTIPARPFMVLQESDWVQIRGAISNWLGEAAK